MSSVPWLMTEKGRLATVVSACAARMSSTSVAALLSGAGGLRLHEQLAERRRLAGELVLHGGVGGDHDAVLVGDARRSLLGEDADDLEARRAELDRLAERVLRRSRTGC